MLVVVHGDKYLPDNETAVLFPAVEPPDSIGKSAEIQCVVV